VRRARWRRLAGVGAAAFLAGLFSGLATAPAQPVMPRVGRAAIEFPQHLASFRASLRARLAGRRSVVRIAHWGDSNVASDLWTQVPRHALQVRFGNGGPGYALPRGHGTWHRDLRIDSAGRWESRRGGHGRSFGPVDGLWGVAGVAISPATYGARLEFDVPAGTEHIELHLLGRPVPGRLEVRVDGGPWEEASTFRPVPTLLRPRLPVRAGSHVEIRHAGGRPRVLGVVAEADEGVVYDVLGINGHRTAAWLRWDPSLLRDQLSNRPPDLAILSYGGNEALDPALGMGRYEEQLRAAVQRLRTVAPRASCLLVGPLATCPEHASRMREVTAIQRRVAPEVSCAFWDPSRVMGGHGGLCRRWARFPGMVSGDRLHLGPEGYEAVGRRFTEALLDAAAPVPID
jgi:lysophospholipase L1-like esterase